MGILIHDIVEPYIVPKYRKEINGTVFYDEESLVEAMPLVLGNYVPSLIIIYLLFVMKIGRIIMEKRRPIELRKIMLVYNFFQVVFNIYLFSSLVFHKDLYFVLSTACYPPKPYSHPIRMQGLFGSYLYLILKITDLLDTVFMVARKKYSHITFLHVFHHSVMVIGVWLSILYARGGPAVTMVPLNNLVHIIMYAYYFITTLGKGPAKLILPFKQYLTRIQIAQFVIGLTYLVASVMYGCEMPQVFAESWFIVVTIIMIFFINFYIKSYMSSSKTKPTTSVKPFVVHKKIRND